MAAPAQQVRGMVIGGLANAMAGAGAARSAPSEAAVLPAWLRTTGNGTFVAFAVPFLVRLGKADRRDWWVYAGSHAPHIAGLLRAAALHRRAGGSFSSASRYGGVAGYATLGALTASAYVPAGRPAADVRLRRFHRAAECFMFGLYACTITHGYRAKGRNLSAYGPLAAVWVIAAVHAAQRWSLPPASSPKSDVSAPAGRHRT
jgi:hypothetical protein